MIETLRTLGFALVALGVTWGFTATIIITNLTDPTTLDHWYCGMLGGVGIGFAIAGFLINFLISLKAEK